MMGWGGAGRGVEGRGGQRRVCCLISQGGKWGSWRCRLLWSRPGAQGHLWVAHHTGRVPAYLSSGKGARRIGCCEGDCILCLGVLCMVGRVVSQMDFSMHNLLCSLLHVPRFLNPTLPLSSLHLTYPCPHSPSSSEGLSMCLGVTWLLGCHGSLSLGSRDV